MGEILFLLCDTQELVEVQTNVQKQQNHTQAHENNWMALAAPVCL